MFNVSFTSSLSQSHRQPLLFDAKYPLTSKNSPPYTSIHRKQYLVKNKRPTKAFEDVIGSGRAALLTLDGISAVEGGVPIIQNGKIIGAIGISGGTSQQDGQVAAAGAKVTM